MRFLLTVKVFEHCLHATSMFQFHIISINAFKIVSLNCQCKKTAKYFQTNHEVINYVISSKIV